MRRVSRFLLRNWPLKVGAVLLATVLYSGLVLSQNVRTFTGTVPVDAIRPPPTATLLADPEPVTMIRYRAPLDVGVLSPDSFNATIDLSRVVAEPGGPPVSVPITLVALDRRVEIVDFVPQSLQIRLDPVEERQVPVSVVLASVPEGVEVGTPQVDPAEVTVRGASSRVATVRSVIARISLDASALNVDRDMELVATDEQGNQVPSVVVEPARARVRISVARQLATRTLVVVPQIVGEPAPGYRLEPVTVRPLTVTVSGEEAVITRMEIVATEPIDITGRENDLDTTVGLELPAGVIAAGPSEVRITLRITPQNETRTYSVAVVPVGAHSDLAYELAATQINITLAGPLSQLVALDEAQLVATLQVADLDVGRHEVPLIHLPPGGLELLAISPAEVVVNVTDRLQLPLPLPTTGPFQPPAT